MIAFGELIVICPDLLTEILSKLEEPELLNCKLINKIFLKTSSQIIKDLLISLTPSNLLYCVKEQHYLSIYQILTHSFPSEEELLEATYASLSQKNLHCLKMLTPAIEYLNLMSKVSLFRWLKQLAKNPLCKNGIDNLRNNMIQAVGTHMAAFYIGDISIMNICAIMAGWDISVSPSELNMNDPQFGRDMIQFLLAPTSELLDNLIKRNPLVGQLLFYIAIILEESEPLKIILRKIPKQESSFNILFASAGYRSECCGIVASYYLDQRLLSQYDEWWEWVAIHFPEKYLEGLHSGKCNVTINEQIIGLLSLESLKTYIEAISTLDTELDISTIWQTLNLREEVVDYLMDNGWIKDASNILSHRIVRILREKYSIKADVVFVKFLNAGSFRVDYKKKVIMANLLGNEAREKAVQLFIERMTEKLVTFSR